MPTILVTGSNKGLGLAFAQGYTAEGWKVIATCRTPGAADELNALAAANDSVEVHGLDVDDFGAIEILGKQLSGTPIDLLLNNAGFKGPAPQGFGQVDYEGWAGVFHTNVLAVMKMTETFADHVALSDKKLIVNVSSGLSSVANKNGPGRGPFGELYLYRTSKSALNMLTKCLSFDLIDRGIAVVGIGPGWVRTALGGPTAKFSPEESIANCIPLIEKFGPDDAGKLYLYDGSEIPW
jgi:NAD(P)-dependent dehydrogenase (short-subunit alcohol dehydrogenase family)